MTEQERLLAFQKSMTALAEADISRLSAEIAAVHAVRLQHEKARTEAGEDACIASARQESARILREQRARATSENRKKLLRLRETLTEELFIGVRQRLANFAASEAYSEFLEGRVRLLRGAMPQEDAVLFLCERDIPLVPVLRSIWSGEIRGAADILLGGARAICASESLLEDETLDSRLEEQYAWFRAKAASVLMEGGAF